MSTAMDPQTLTMLEAEVVVACDEPFRVMAGASSAAKGAAASVAHERAALGDLARAGHWPTMICSLFYFTVSFMVWVLPGALGNALAAEFRLAPLQQGLMVAIPLLGGALLRVVMGILADWLRPKRSALLGLALTAVPLLLGWLWVSRFDQLLLVGLLLGVAGASFAVALPMASRWYSARQQGLVLGIAGMGNAGTALATLLAPRLVPMVGWRGVFGLALVPVSLAFVACLIVAKDAPAQAPRGRWRDYLPVLSNRDTYWFCAFYAVTFGGFVGLCAFLPLFFVGQFGITPVRAGLIVTLCALVGSLVRPLGGYLADRHGGVKMLLLFYVMLGFLSLILAGLPGLGGATVALVLMMGLLGMGNGAVFQLVPQRFQREIGAVTGIVGAAGGLGGFFLPLLLGGIRQWTGSYAAAFLVLALICGEAAGLLALASSEWERRFLARTRPQPAPGNRLSPEGA